MEQRTDNEPPQILSLEGLRKVNPETEVDVIKKKLAILFELREANTSLDLIDPETLAEQSDALDTIHQVSDEYVDTIQRKSKTVDELSTLIQAVDNSRMNENRSVPDIHEFPELYSDLPLLVSTAREIKLVDSLQKSKDGKPNSLEDLYNLFDQNNIPYNKHNFELAYTPFSQSDNLRMKAEKTLFKLRKGKQREVSDKISTSVKTLRSALEKRLRESSMDFQSVIIAKVEGLKEKATVGNLQDTVDKLLSVYQYLDVHVVDVHSYAIPEEYYTLKKTCHEKISATIDELIEQYVHERNELQDTTNDSHIALGKLITQLSQMNVILSNVKKAAGELVKIVTIKRKNESFQEVEEIERLCEEKRVAHFAINRPDDLRKNLYEMYQNLSLPRSEKKRFLKIAIKLFEELIFTQTESFLAGYDEVYQKFSEAGLSEITLSQLDIRKIFFKKGYEINSENRIDFSDALARAKNTHNRIVRLLSSSLDIKIKDSAALGKELFQAYIRKLNLDTSKFPYGVVKLDITPPISSIRLIVEDQRDYKFISNELNSELYSKGVDNNYRASGGSSYSSEQPFLLEDNTLVFLPLTTINGEQTTEGITRAQKHEDAHQIVIINQENGNTQLSAEHRVDNSVFKDFTFDNSVVLSEYEQSNYINDWRSNIKMGLVGSFVHVRDEVQAYLTGGDEFPAIKENLSKTTKEAFYDYVCDFHYRATTIEKIKINFQDEDVQKKLIRIFKRDVMKAKDLFDSQRNKFIDRVESLHTLFYQNDPIAAKNKTAILVRHTTPDELFSITRYLRRSEKYKDEKRLESAGKTTPKEQFSKQPTFDKILALTDKQFSQLLATAKPAIKIMIPFIEKIIAIAPKHFFDLIPELDTWPIATPMTESGIKNLLSIFLKVIKMAESKVYWTEKEKEERGAFIDKYLDYYQEMNDDQYLVGGKNFLSSLDTAVNSVVK